MFAAILVAILLALVCVLIVLEVSGDNEPADNTVHTGSGCTDSTDDTEAVTEPRPWDQPGAKQPADYTWEEFLALSPELQMPFQDAFDSSDAFEVWMNRVQPTNPETNQNGYPWEQPGAKRPEEYTWEEFLNLPAELQMPFQYAFGSSDAFENWMNRTQSAEPEQNEYPWKQPGAKRLEDYTWEEFLALSPELQIAFQYAFSSTDAFEDWLYRTMPQS